jgi:hypothetical protein
MLGKTFFRYLLDQTNMSFTSETFGKSLLPLNQ